MPQYSQKIMESSLVCHTLNLQEATVNKKTKTIENARFIAKGWSLNERYYSKEALATLIPLIKESPGMFDNHKDVSSGRDLRELISDITSVYQKPNGDLYGNITMSGNPATEWLFDLVERNKKAVNLSIYSWATSHVGEAEGKQGVIIDEFIGHHSVDWVYKAGAKGGFAEGELLIPMSNPEAISILENLDNPNILDISKENLLLENFANKVYLENLLYLCDWLNSYLFYEILWYSNETPDKKKEMIADAIKAFSEIYMKTVEESGILYKTNPFDYMDDTAKEAIVKKLDSLFEKYPSLQKYEEFAKEILYKENNTMTMKELQDKFPDVYNALQAQAALDAHKTFQDTIEKFNTIEKDLKESVETLESEMSTFKSTIESQKSDIEKLQTENKTLSEKVKTYEEAEAKNDLVVKQTAREAFITNKLTELKMEATDVPSALMTKLKTETFSEAEVAETLADLNSKREVQKKGLPGGQLPNNDDTTKSTLDTVESTIFPVIK
jgi:hypothetical protein